MHQMALKKQQKSNAVCRVDYEKNAVSYMTEYIIKNLSDGYKESSCGNRDLF